MNHGRLLALWPIVVIAILVLVLGGCTSSKYMDIYDLRYMQVDCANKDAQLAFLETQIPSQTDRAMATPGLVSSLWAALNNDYANNRATFDGEREKLVKSLIWDIRTQCQ